jgi:hypothetical protein
MASLTFVMLNRYFLIISIGLHLVLFFETRLQTKKKPRKLVSKTTLKIKKQKTRKNKSRIKKGPGPNISWNSLRFAGNSNSAKITRGKYSSTIYEIIDSAMVYPEELAAVGISGQVHAKIFISSKGHFREEYSYFKGSSKYLEICVRKILRKSLKNNHLVTSKDQGVHKAIFEFKLTTALKDNMAIKSGLDGMYFYRRRYGVSNGIDKINKGVTEVLGAIMNPLSLLRFLPSVKEHKKKRIKRKLETYQRDEYF